MFYITQIFFYLSILCYTQSSYSMEERTLQPPRRKQRSYSDTSPRKNTFYSLITHISPKNHKKVSPSDTPPNYNTSSSSTASPTEHTDLITLLEGTDINTPDSKGRTDLIWAARKNKFLILKTILTFDHAYVNAQDQKGNTALHYAAKNTNINLVQLLLLDPRVDGSIPNIKSRMPRDLMRSDLTADLTAVKGQLFARAMLDTAIKNELYIQELINPIQFKKDILQKKYQKELIIKIRTVILEKLQQDEEHQEAYQPLPEEYKIPLYAKKELFLDAKIAHFVECKMQHIKLHNY